MDMVLVDMKMEGKTQIIRTEILAYLQVSPVPTIAVLCTFSRMMPLIALLFFSRVFLLQCFRGLVACRAMGG
jgi:hypothetical protein